MRFQLIHAVVAATAVLAAACSHKQQYPQQPSSAFGEPTPQQPTTHPTPQQPGGEIGGAPKPQAPATNPSPQQPAMHTAGPQQPISGAEPQKPFYGPGLTPPQEQAEARAKSAEPLKSDAEILSFAVAVDQNEIQMADYAKRNATRKDVKNFAAMMSTFHTQSMNKIRKVQSDRKIELADNDLSKKVRDVSSDDMSMLREKKGKDFDRIYMDSQVRFHKDVLDLLDHRVLPGVSNDEVKTTMHSMRREVADHLSKAEGILKKIDAGEAAAIEEKTTSGKAKAKTTTEKPKTKSNP